MRCMEQLGSSSSWQCSKWLAHWCSFSRSPYIHVDVYVFSDYLPWSQTEVLVSAAVVAVSMQQLEARGSLVAAVVDGVCSWQLGCLCSAVLLAFLQLLLLPVLRKILCFNATAVCCGLWCIGAHIYVPALVDCGGRSAGWGWLMPALEQPFPANFKDLESSRWRVGTYDVFMYWHVAFC